MSFLQNLFKKSDAATKPGLGPNLKVDMHCHLLPGIDDGVESFEEAMEIIVLLKGLGYQASYCTPHVMGDFYRNESSTIKGLAAELNAKLQEQGIDYKVLPSAEYYMDEHFMELIQANDLMPIGKNYILMETSFTQAPPNFNEIAFELTVRGYKPILAHPERYLYMVDKYKEYRDWYDRGVAFQINISSLAGYYSPESKKIAEQLIADGMCDFLGTDIHSQKYLPTTQQGLNSSAFAKNPALVLHNHSLLQYFGLSASN